MGCPVGIGPEVAIKFLVLFIDDPIDTPLILRNIKIESGSNGLVLSGKNWITSTVSWIYASRLLILLCIRC